MKLKITSLLMIIVICMSVIGCTQSDKISTEQIGKPVGNIIAVPDKIIIHNISNSKELDKTNPELKNIVKLTNSRFHDKISTAKDIIDDTQMQSIFKDGLGIEFIYSDEQELSINGDGFKPFKYNKLYFQLISEKYGDEQGSPVHNMQYGDKEQYKDWSIGPLKYSEDLVKVVENLK